MKEIIRALIIVCVIILVGVSMFAPLVGKPVPVDTCIPFILGLVGINYIELTKNSSNED